MIRSRSNKLRRMWPIRADYHFKAEFATADAAPIADPYLCDVGQLDVNDTANHLSVAGGALVADGGESAWGNPGVWSVASYARQAGRALIIDMIPGDVTLSGGFGWDADQAGILSVAALKISIEKLYRYIGVGSLELSSMVDSTQHKFAIILRATGALYIRDSTLLYVDASGTTTPVFVGISDYTLAFSCSEIRVLDLKGAWAQDYGIARAREITPSGVAFETTKDFIAEISIANDPGGARSGMELCTDGVDDWVRVYHNGTNATMKKTVGGVETGLIDAAAAYAAGMRLVVVKDGTSWSLYSNEAKVGATQTINDGSIKDTPTHKSYKTGAAVNNNFVLWPRFVTMPRGV